jgi:hypothetical protein
MYKESGDISRITEQPSFCDLPGLAKHYLAMVPFLIKTQTRKIGVSTATSTSRKTQMIPLTIFMFAPCVKRIKILFIVPTDAHYYKIVGMLKHLKM